MFSREALVVLLVLLCLFGTAFLLTPSKPVLAYCCSSTYYAWSRRPDLKAVCRREAKYWNKDARQHGLDVGETPENGAIVVFEAGVQGADAERDCRETGGLNYGSGHVAHVEQVLSPVRFKVSEKGRSPGRGARARRTAMAYTEEGVSFIYETVHVRPGFDNLEPDTAEDPQSQSNQRWHFVPEGDYFKIVAAHSGKCLDVSRASLHGGADIVQWDCHAGSNQLWWRVPQGDDYVLIAKHSGKCLDVRGDSLSNGASLLQWDCPSEAN